MKNRLVLGGWVCALALAARGQAELEITSVQDNGVVGWTYPTNLGWTSFRVEWAAQAAGPWDTFSNAAARLEGIAPTGAAMSAAVPMFYRVVAAAPTHDLAVFFRDDYEADPLGGDITDVFRTPAIGPAASAAWYEGHGASAASVVTRLAGQAAQVAVPAGTALDYVARLGQTNAPAAFLLSWEMEFAQVNGGGGMFFVRFPRADDNGMQVLFGFLDDGRVIRFFDEPATNTFVAVGAFQAGTRYRTHFIYDLASAEYSVLFGETWVVDHAPIPAHFKMDGIHQFGFDVNQTLGLPGQPALGNVYYVDDVTFAPLSGGH